MDFLKRTKFTSRPQQHGQHQASQAAQLPRPPPPQAQQSPRRQHTFLRKYFESQLTLQNLCLAFLIRYAASEKRLQPVAQATCSPVHLSLCLFVSLCVCACVHVPVRLCACVSVSLCSSSCSDLLRRNQKSIDDLGDVSFQAIEKALPHLSGRCVKDTFFFVLTAKVHINTQATHSLTHALTRPPEPRQSSCSVLNRIEEVSPKFKEHTSDAWKQVSVNTTLWPRLSQRQYQVLNRATGDHKAHASLTYKHEHTHTLSLSLLTSRMSLPSFSNTHEPTTADCPSRDQPSPAPRRC